LRVLVVVLLLVSCGPPEATKKERCEQFGRTVDRPTKLIDECFVRCPEPVGWITWWMWQDNHGCAPNPVAK
jgi:hypothetical protein